MMPAIPCTRQRHGFLLLLALLALGASTGTAAAPAAFEAAIPESHTIRGLPLAGQAWNLSCEFAAVEAATGLYDAAIAQWTFLDEIGYDENPHKGFRGNIDAAWGGTTNYGIYAEPIASVLQNHGFEDSYVFYGGIDTLRQEVANGHPVVTWVTGTWSASYRYVRVDEDGDRYSLIPYEHAVTVYGYDDDDVWVMDPAYPDKYAVSWNTFLLAWGQIDGMSLVVAP